MTPLASWLLIAAFALLGVAFTLVATRWLDDLDDDFDDWRHDIERWDAARDALENGPYDHEQENRR